MIACREIENTQRKQGERIIVPVWTKEKWEKLRKAQNLADLINLVAELKISNEAIQLIFLFHNEKKMVSAEDLTRFVQSIKPDAREIQTRQLKNKNWFVKGANSITENGELIRRGMFYLQSKTDPVPNRVNVRAKMTSKIDKERVKYKQICRCATCGLEEGTILPDGTQVKLQLGHQDPNDYLLRTISCTSVKDSTRQVVINLSLMKTESRPK